MACIRLLPVQRPVSSEYFGPWGPSGRGHLGTGHLPAPGLSVALWTSWDGSLLAIRLSRQDENHHSDGRGPMKGVLLAGGTGSRLYPLTRITNKHLLPIYDRPMIAWSIEAVVSSGIDEIMLVTGGTHAGEFLRLLGNGREYGINQLSYAYQEKAGGIAEALGLAEHFAGGGPVLVMLADNIVERSIRPTVEAFRADPVGARILLSKVTEPEHLRHLGVPVFGDDGLVTHIEEKPEHPASD